MRREVRARGPIPVRVTASAVSTTCAQPVADLVGLLLAGRLDHHPDQRLGARRPDEHAAPAGQTGVLAGDRLLHAGIGQRGGQSGAVRRADVDQALGSFSIASRSARSRPPSASSVSSALAIPSPEGPKPEIDDVAGLLAAERPAPLAELVEHVAVADGGGRHLDPRRLHRPVKAVVGHDRDGHAVAGQPARASAGGARPAPPARRRRRPRRAGRPRAPDRRRRRTRTPTS